ncbi:GNAT family N-acetyltransferase [Phototrophicus methaneseepsis]|uniref:GNAT family N-acetyltransferase n=1 Tax=Phototrophicus methaneseepsis TaxID=2710758 RepID=A0A7S8EC20_9CHLR|nr:GNAT family protein [Phototrophicus methaneseepsis]QPC84213.1 GNAT family N-acetyltransferase [Phototrophicus methaneseepsis]
MQPGDLFRGLHIRLTALGPEDIPVITSWYHDSHFVRLYEAKPAFPRSQRHWQRWWENDDKENDIYKFAIRPLDSDRLIGLIDLDGIIWSHGTAWVSIGIGDPANRGHGYGEEAMRLLLNFAFNELNLFRIQLSVFEYNIRAIALYERLGFVREGAYRQFLARDGKRFDMYLYGLLAEEWHARER